MKKIDFSKKNIEIENPIIYPSLSENEDEYHTERESDQKKYSFWIFRLAIIFLLILASRTFYLQIVKGEEYKKISEDNRVNSLVLKAPRGLIKDSRGTLLAQNIPSFDLVFTPIYLHSNKGNKEEITKKISTLMELNEESLKMQINAIEKNSTKTYLIKENINEKQALIFLERAQEFPGFYLEKNAVREYIDGKIFSHIMGYSGKINQEELANNPEYFMNDYIGKSGVEYTYEKWLKGKHGIKKVEVDSNGNIKEELGTINPQRGSTLILNIDAELQRKIYEVLNKILEKNEDATAASVVAINPQNGAVIALVNNPTYDNNLFSHGISPEDYSTIINDNKKPMLNRAISGEYPPGSTFKPFVATAALEENIIQENTTLNCPGLISIGSWKFPDWKTHGTTDIKKAIAESCDVFFYAIGGGWENIQGLGINRIKKYVEMFNLGKLTGIDLPWEETGNIPNEDWKFKIFGEKWYIGDDYHCAIGQGFITATPLQLSVGTATIANGGNLYRPQIIDKIENSRGDIQDIEPELIKNNFVSSKNIDIVRRGMRQTVEGDSGSARSLNSLKKATAGKTGTAQFGTEDKTHSWFISFGPFDNPSIAMTVLIEEGGDGHDWAVPATKEILEWYYNNRE